jgi:hypothetical protein
LAVELRADLLLIDDREGVVESQRNGIEATGTLGVLARAAKRNLLNLSTAFEYGQHDISSGYYAYNIGYLTDRKRFSFT